MCGWSAVSQDDFSTGTDVTSTVVASSISGYTLQGITIKPKVQVVSRKISVEIRVMLRYFLPRSSILGKPSMFFHQPKVDTSTVSFWGGSYRFCLFADFWFRSSKSLEVEEIFQTKIIQHFIEVISCQPAFPHHSKLKMTSWEGTSMMGGSRVVVSFSLRL